LKELAKAIARGAATLVILPMLVSYWLRAAVLGRNRALEGSSELLSLVPGLVGQYLRRAFLARVLVRCHKSAYIGFGTVFSKCGAVIEENVYIGPRCHIGLAHLERDVLLASGVHIPSGGQSHGTADLDVPIRDQPTKWKMVRIGAGTWVGSAAVVMADVGRDTVIGAGAVVTKPITDRVVAAGVPARVLKRRDEPASVGQPPDQTHDGQ
jgi:acetyltransferase-like isoleucine patch superfamily enzyme